MMKCYRKTDNIHLIFIPLIPSDLCERLKERIKNETGKKEKYTCLFTLAYQIDELQDEISVSSGFKIFYETNGEKQEHSIHIWLNNNDCNNEVLTLIKTLKPYIDKQLHTKNLLPK